MEVGVKFVFYFIDVLQNLESLKPKLKISKTKLKKINILESFKQCYTRIKELTSRVHLRYAPSWLDTMLHL